ncbi:MAG: twin-arginine translocase subunit TatC [Alphaproteobacteria bacterium]|nr:twin-arginine translocase subunit TatC [Alphaproteobacteria bacterium]
MSADKSHDEIEGSRASLIEHLFELRVCLIKILVTLFFAFSLCLFFAGSIFNILLWPFERAVGDVNDVKLIYTAPQEFFFTQIKLALFGAVFLGSPFFAFQVYRFIAPGLYKNERKIFLPFLLATPFLFLLGGAVVYFLIMPAAMHFFLGYQQLDENLAQIELIPRVSEYLSLLMTLSLAFGFCFQLPVVLGLLACIGMIGSDMLRSSRKYAIVLAFVLAAFLTPPDPVSQIGLAIPTILLYELSIFGVSLIEGRRSGSDSC